MDSSGSLEWPTESSFRLGILRLRNRALPLNVMARTVELTLVEEVRSPDPDGAPSNSEMVGRSVWESRSSCSNAELELELEALTRSFRASPQR